MADYNLSVTAADLNAAITKANAAAPQSTTYTKTETNNLLNAKQATLTTAQQAAVDSGITSAKVTQYDKDSAALPELIDGGAKNLSSVDSGTNGSARYAEIAISIPAGTYIVYCETLASDDTDSTTCAVGFFADGTRVSTPSTSTIDRGNGVYIELTLSAAADALRIYAADTSANAENDTMTFSGLMVCTKAAWDISQAYKPYAPTNRELYEMILALQAGT